jgi:LmbE family N-acetylglucosaminyl deacetylase|tara:strand:+ start:395 stop:1126 length:732 start_codon:yes stop_codon:yes gene_type:complete
MAKILIVSAHPDDEIIGMGGIIKKLSRKHEIQILFLADGITARKSSGYLNSTKYEISKSVEKKMKNEIENRKKHARNALKILGVTKMKFLDLPDNELDTIPFLKIVKEIENEIQSTKCDVIFTHHYNDLNIDHRLAYEASITSSRPIFNSEVKSIFSFEAISSTDWKKPYKFNPNLFIDISKELPFKLKALREYKNEIQKFPHPRSIKAIEANAIRWGSLSGFNAAEALELVNARLTNFSLFD